MRRDVLANAAHTQEQCESAEPSPKHDERGAVVAHWVRCGRPWCRCMRDGSRHGPYYLQVWREGGRRYKRYVRLEDAAQARAACIGRQVSERDERAQAEAARRQWREVRALLKEIERGER